MILKPHQVRAIAEVKSAIASGEQRILVTAPCGAGKSLCMRELIRWAIAQDWKVVLYSNRKLLREQLSSGLEAEGIEHGVRASGHKFDYWQQVQVSSIQTEERRVFKTNAWELHAAQLVLVDEAHVNRTGTAAKIINSHVSAGAFAVGWSATPVELEHLYKRLIQAGTNSELRECGLHLPCYTYGPDEPDLRSVGPVKVGEDLSEEQNRKAIMRPGIFGRVYKSWKELNPDARPAILFAPGVGESIWFAEQYKKNGVKAAHIDAKHVWVDGEQYATTDELRQQVLNDVRCGDIKVICNRFVLREGIDVPELYHCILASVMMQVSTFLQSAGRVIRAHPSLPGHVILQDHTGAYHRHGSINADREWNLGDTNKSIAEARLNRLREKKEQEPIVCPQCSKVRQSGPKCPSCGYESSMRSRMVVQANGRLVPYTGDIYKPRVTKQEPDTEKKWKQMYYRAKNGNMTFQQAYGLYFKQFGYFPERNLSLMPRDDLSWHRKVKDVKWAELYAAERSLEN